MHVASRSYIPSSINHSGLERDLAAGRPGLGSFLVQQGTIDCMKASLSSLHLEGTVVSEVNGQPDDIEDRTQLTTMDKS